MSDISELKRIIEQYCTTAEIFERTLSTLLVTSHTNGIDVSGAWEAHENGSSPEWDVVVTELARGHHEEMPDSDRTTDGSS